MFHKRGGITLRIAICDDNSSVCAFLKERIAAQYDNAHSVDVFDSPELLQGVAGTRDYDLIFLDIVFEGRAENGIDISRDIVSGFPQSRIVYITSYVMEFVNEIFSGTMPYGFITKPPDEQKLFYYIDKRATELNRNEKAVRVTRGGVDSLVLMRDIYYIESSGRLVNIYTPDGVCAFYDTLDGISSQLDDRFVRCHQSFVANMDYVRQLGATELQMTVGEPLPISRSRLAQTRKIYFEYKQRSKL